MSGSTLLTLRTRVRDLLNEPTAAFWTNAQLNRYIKQACDRYYGVYSKIVPEFGNMTSDITYTASAESVTVTISTWTFKEALFLEDRTNSQPGTTIPFADSLEALWEKHRQMGDSTVAGEPVVAYLTHKQDITTGVVSETLTVYLAPYPVGSKTLRLHYRAEPADISGGDTYTTGLPLHWDDPVVFQACIYARMQEEKPNLDVLYQELKRAEESAYSLSGNYRRNMARVRWDGDD